MHSDFRSIFIIAKRINIIVFLILIIALLYSQNSHSLSAADCPGGYSAGSIRTSTLSNFSYYTSINVSCDDVSSCGVNKSYLATISVGFTSSGNASETVITCPEVCLATCDDEIPDDEDNDHCPEPEFFLSPDGSCTDADNCDMGTSLNSLTGSCESDDCPTGQYVNASGQCNDIPCPEGQVLNLGICTTPLPDDDDDDSGDDDSGDDGSSGGGTDDATCNDYSECRSLALDASACKENDRDYFVFQYIGPDDYAAECDTCEGPNYLAYSECQDGACTFGYDSVSNSCYTLDCPFGDCADPTGDGALETDPLPTNPDNTDERLSEVITAINSVRDSIEADETPEKIEELKQDLVTTLDSNSDAVIDQLVENQDSNTSDNESIIELLQEINLNVDSDSESGTGKDYTDLLNQLLDNSDDLLCQINPKRAGCDVLTETTVDIISPSERIIDGIENSGIYSALSEFQDISINVTSTCPSSFRFQLTFMGTYYVDVCSVFDPIVPLIRALFIGFWGLVSFRALTDA
jgi:hypothetical protein